MIVRRILFIKKDLNLTLVNNYIHENMIKIFGYTKNFIFKKMFKNRNLSIFIFTSNFQSPWLYYTQWLMIFRKKRENAINVKCFYITIKISLEILKVNRSYFIYISYCWNDDYKNNIFSFVNILFSKEPEYFHWPCIKLKLS